MLHQRFGLGWHAAAREVRRATRRGCRENTARRRAASDASSRQVAHAERDVEILADQVDPPRRQVDLERDRRIVARRIRRGAAPSTRLAKSAGIDTRSRPLGSDLPVLRQATPPRPRPRRDVTGMLQHGVAEIGDRELARGAQQQALAQLRFERREPARDGRFGQPQALGRPREAAFVDDAGEEQKVVGFDGQRRFDCAIRATMLSISTTSDLIPCNKYIRLRAPRSTTHGADHEHPANQFQRPPRRHRNRPASPDELVAAHCATADPGGDADRARPRANPAPGARRSRARRAVHAGRSSAPPSRPPASRSTTR